MKRYRCKRCNNLIFAPDDAVRVACDKCQARAPARPESLIGATVDEYLVTGELGRGAMGIVYRATDTMKGREVALKQILVDNPVALERFRREARLAAMLAHPNIVAVYRSGEYEGVPYFISELVAGGSLEERLDRSGPLPAAEAVRLIRDTARGLAAAHARGVVHRDIKPANILLDAAGTPKLADFGLARETADPLILTRTGYVVGTAAFIAPEVCRGERGAAAADIYALGCTLYMLLTGVHPFQAASVGELIKMHQTQPFPDPRDRVPLVSAAICEVLQRACAKEPSDRPASADAFAEELDAALSGSKRNLAKPAAPAGNMMLSLEQRRPSVSMHAPLLAPVPSAAPGSSSRWLIAVAALLGALLVGAAVWFRT